MSEMNQRAWEKTIDENLEWLSQHCGHRALDLEYRHIVDCLNWLREHKPTAPVGGKEQR